MLIRKKVNQKTKGDFRSPFATCKNERKKMKANYQYHNSIFNISTAICHINDAHKKLFHIYFATRHHEY